MIKKRAILTVEAALIFPLLIFFFFMAIDIGFISYAKSNALSILKDAIYRASEEAYQMKNSDFNALASRSAGLEEELDMRSSRSLFDDFYMNIDLSSYQDRLREELKKGAGIDQGCINISCDINNIMGFVNMSVHYDFEVNAIFKKFYKKLNPDFCKLRGDITADYTKHFDAISSIDVIEKLLKKSKTLTSITDKFRGNMEELSGKIKGK